MLLLSACVVPAATEERPVPLQPATCELPLDLQGVAGHALVRYDVGAAGRVVSARTAYVVSESRALEEDLAAALKGCVQAWRYEAPSPPATLLAAFHFFRPAPVGAAIVRVPDGRTLPLVHLDEMRKRKLELARRLLSARSLRETRGDGWTLETDLPEDKLPVLAGSVRLAHAVFDLLFPGLAPAGGPALAIHVFRRQEDFNLVAAFDDVEVTHRPLAGQYQPRERAVFLSAGGRGVTRASRIVMHEVAHHLVQTRLYPGSRVPPFWANEGIASMLETVRDPGDGRVDPSLLDRGVRSEGAQVWETHAERYLRWGALAIREGALVDQLRITVTPEVAEKDYAVSWLMVHFLVNGSGGAHREPFRRWLLEHPPGAGPDTLLAALGRSKEQLQAALEAHLTELTRQKAE